MARSPELGPEMPEETIRLEREKLIKELRPLLEPGIARAVIVLLEHGVETYQSCEGGPGHPSPEPIVQFHGQRAEGFRALGIALQYALPVKALRRVWSIEDDEPTGPDWELAFREVTR